MDPIGEEAPQLHTTSSLGYGIRSCHDHNLARCSIFPATRPNDTPPPTNTGMVRIENATRITLEVRVLGVEHTCVIVRDLPVLLLRCTPTSCLCRAVVCCTLGYRRYGSQAGLKTSRWMGAGSKDPASVVSPRRVRSCRMSACTSRVVACRILFSLVFLLAGPYPGDPPYTSAAAAFVNKGLTVSNNLIYDVGQRVGHGAGVWLFQTGASSIVHNYIKEVRSPVSLWTCGDYHRLVCMICRQAPRNAVGMYGERFGAGAGFTNGGLPAVLYNKTLDFWSALDVLTTRDNVVAYNQVRPGVVALQGEKVGEVAYAAAHAPVARLLGRECRSRFV